MEFMAMVWGWIVANAPLVFNTTYDYLVLSNVLNLCIIGVFIFLCLAIIGCIFVYRKNPENKWNTYHNGFHEFLMGVLIAAVVIGVILFGVFLCNVHSYILLTHAKNYMVVEHLIHLIR